jgi:tetratricopeptide (TPR) repeat protein
MKKKSAPVADRPQAAQLDAIRRLIEKDDLDEAATRIAQLLHRFPHFKPLLGLAWDVAQATGNDHAASVAAWDWTQASPNSAAAWQALMESASRVYPGLALQALRRKDALAGEPSPEAPADMPTPFGPLSFEQAVRMDTCRMLLSAGRLDAAEAAIADLDHVSARNNLALVTFAKGEVERALAALEENWQAAPENLYGLERILRLRLWTGGWDRVDVLGDTLAAATPLRADDLRAKLSGLILLGRFDAADVVWLEAKPEFIEYSPEIWNDCHYLAACAAWRMGRENEALAHLRAAGEDTACEAKADDLLLASEDSPDWTVGELAAWWPLANTNAIRANTDKDDDALLTIVERLAPHNDYLAVMAEYGGVGARTLAFLQLKARADRGDATAVAALKTLLGRPCGPDRVRTGLQGWLLDGGLLTPGSTGFIWLEGALQEVRHRAYRIVNSSVEDDLPLEDAERYARAVGFLHQVKFSKAAAELEQVLKHHPDHPRILSNLAIVWLNLDRPLDEIASLAGRAFAIDPDYPFARIALAYVLLRRGDPESAVKMVEPILARDEVHVSEWHGCLNVQLQAARATGDQATATRLIRALDESEALFSQA